MKEIKQFIENNNDRILNELFDLLKIKSVSADGNYKNDIKNLYNVNVFNNNLQTLSKTNKKTVIGNVSESIFENHSQTRRFHCQDKNSLRSNTTRLVLSL